MARTVCIHKTATSCTPSATIYPTIQTFYNSVDRAADGDTTGVICDSVAYDEVIGVSKATSGTSAIRLTANDGTMFTHIDGSPVGSVRGDGSFRDGARIDGSHGDELIDLRTDYVIFDHLSFIQRSTTSTRDDGIRVRYQNNDIGVINCTFEDVSTNADQDGIHLGYNPTEYQNFLIAGCSFLNWTRSAISRWQSSNSATHVGDNLVVVGCGAYSDTATDPFSSFIHIGEDSPDDTDDVYVYNNAGGYHEVSSSRVASFTDSDTNTPGATPEGTVSWTGTHNYDDGFGLGEIEDDSGLTDWISGSADPSTVDTTQTSGTYWVVEDLTAGTASFVPLDDAAGNAIIGAGTARANLPSAGTFLDGWWETVNGTQTTDKRGYRFGDTPEIGPYSLVDNEDTSDIPFIAQITSV